MKEPTPHSFRCLFLCLSVCSLLLTGADWPGFRGPDGSGVSDATGLPVRWSGTRNVAWKRQLPGPGGSSPITLGERIFITCYSGYGENDRDPGDQEDLVRHLLCIRRGNGEIVWDAKVKADLPETGYRGFQALHGYASSTPATDGERVYAFFGKTGVFAFDMEGKQLWKASVGTRTHGWGSANSPVLFGDLVIVNASVESRSLVALNKQTGREVWRASGMRSSWNTPLLVNVGDKQELVVSVQGSLLGFDPAGGEQLWRCDGIDDYVCPSVVAKDGVVYAIGGRRATAIAVRAGGRGDVTESHRLWTQQAGSNVSSPLVHGGHLYWISDRGIAYCLDRKSGDVIFRERMRTGTVYASAVAADGRIYAVSRERGTFVLAAKPSFQQLAHNSIDSDRSIFNGSPAVHNGALLLRSDRFLYCIGGR